jgi:hypothetical protein
MEHRAPVKLLRLFFWFAKALTSLQVFPISVISSSIVLLQVFLGHPLLAPWGFQSNTSFSMVPAGFLKVCPIPHHFLFLFWMSVGSCFVISHRELFDIVSGRLMFKLPLKHPGLVKWDLWWTKWRRGRFSPSTSVFPANLHSTDCFTITIIYHLGLVQ